MLIGAAHAKLHHIGRFDERIAAHLDGIGVAGMAGWQCCEATLANASAGALFTATVRALEDADERAIDAMLAIAESAAGIRKGLLSAFGWVSARQLRGIVRLLLESSSHFRKAIGIASCVMHRVDPGRLLDAAISDPEPMLRARALQAAGDLGRDDLLPLCIAALNDPDLQCQFWAAWSSVILGDRRAGLAKLIEHAHEPARFSRNPLQLALMATDRDTGKALLTQIAKERGPHRNLIRGVAAAGDPDFVPWLIGLMSDASLARIVGEAFSWITGADLAWLDLDRKPPQDIEVHPTDDPDDADVALDEDFGLPWPDTEKVNRWWHGNANRFHRGSRYFVGAPPSREHCVQVLREGYQRQRVAAVCWSALSGTDRVTFDCAAPTWRQRRWLDPGHAKRS